MIGERLRQLRKDRGLTQQQLAIFLNSAKSTVSQYENNINEPDLHTLVRLADYFGVSVDYMLGREPLPYQAFRGTDSGLLRERLSDEENEYLQESLKLFRRLGTRKEAPPSE